ncbi:MAG: SMC-Scp complex subunit ScpB [Alphaproteobacteria bacterium]
MTDENQSLRLIEALLFASAEPVEEGELALRCEEGADLDALLERLRSIYANRGVNLVRVGKRWAFRTAPDLAPLLRTEKVVTRKLSRAAVETLAIIAYHQPMTRTEIEEVRGVALSRGTLDILFEAGWVEPRGRRRTPGRPLTWGTTPAFLDQFGLEGLDDLPGVDELKAAGLLAPVRPSLGKIGPVEDAQGAEEAEEEDETHLAEISPGEAGGKAELGGAVG